MNKSIADAKKLAACALLRLALSPLKLLPVRKNRVLFVSYRGAQYSCSPRAVSEALERLSGGRLEIGWAFHDAKKFAYLGETGVRVLDDASLQFLIYALTARVVCTNAYYKPFLPRRRGQFYLRTWHGGGAYKKVGRAAKTPLFSRLFIAMQQQGASLYLSSGRAFTQTTLREAFGYKGEVLSCGLPRNDVLFRPKDPAQIARIKAEIGVPEGKKLVLYAPTYRDDAVLRDFHLDFQGALRALESRFGGDFAFVYRGHHVVAAENERGLAGAIDATAYPDMQPLLLAADALITDYSSCIWDASLNFTPVFLFAPDLSRYTAARDFFTDIRTWPFPLAETNCALQANIRAFDSAAYAARVKKHHEELGICETGRASEIAARRIMRECGLEETI